jgi:TorA maturation chaperone TorD
MTERQARYLKLIGELRSHRRQLRARGRHQPEDHIGLGILLAAQAAWAGLTYSEQDEAREVISVWLKKGT